MGWPFCLDAVKKHASRILLAMPLSKPHKFKINTPPHPKKKEYGSDIEKNPTKIICNDVTYCAQNKSIKSLVTVLGCDAASCSEELSQTHRFEKLQTPRYEGLSKFFFCTRGLGVLPGSTARG